MPFFGDSQEKKDKKKRKKDKKKDANISAKKSAYFQMLENRK